MGGYGETKIMKKDVDIRITFYYLITDWETTLKWCSKLSAKGSHFSDEENLYMRQKIIK
jgi:hypothetical protein